MKRASKYLLLAALLFSFALKAQNSGYQGLTTQVANTTQPTYCTAPSFYLNSSNYGLMACGSDSAYHSVTLGGGAYTALASGTDLNTVTTAGTYQANTAVNGPAGISATYFNLFVIQAGTPAGNYVTQIAYDAVAGTNNSFIRTKSTSTWTAWAAQGAIGASFTALASGTDLNTITGAGTYQAHSPVNGPSGISNAYFSMVVIQAGTPAGSYVTQYAYDSVAGTNNVFIRTKGLSSWTAWAAQSYNAAAVAITGGTIDGAALGNTTPVTFVASSGAVSSTQANGGFQATGTNGGYDTPTFRFYESAGIAYIYDKTNSWPVITIRQYTGAATFRNQVQAASFLSALTTPASSSAACTAGQTQNDATYMYVCTATNSWKRVALTTF